MRRFLPIFCTFFLCLVPCLGVMGIASWLLTWYPEFAPACVFAAVPLVTAGLLSALLVQRDRMEALEGRVHTLEKQISSFENREDSSDKEKNR
nr:hypothetical protein [uncultured Oscillibacter sp.]